MAKIISYERIGEVQTYDLEVGHKDHQFYLSNGILTSNSHATSYSIISFQCAWLATYYPTQWALAYLQFESGGKPEEKQAALSQVKKSGFKVSLPAIESSGLIWEASEDGKTLHPPITSFKGLGEKAASELIANRPYKCIEELCFNENIDYRVFNKKALDILFKAKCLNHLIDSRFKNKKHFYSLAVEQRANLKTVENFHKAMSIPFSEPDFTKEELGEFYYVVTGDFPYLDYFTESAKDYMRKRGIKGIKKTDIDEGDYYCWFILREFETRKTSTGKDYYIFKVVDSTSETVMVKVWGVDKLVDIPRLNTAYEAKITKDSWGYSVRNFKRDLKPIK